LFSNNLQIHRDLKPENVLLMREGRLKLADFGFCKQLKSNTGTTRTFCGTAEYIAPEIYQYLNYSFPVDYWSLGIMIYEMIVLTTPFYHSNEIEIKDHVINGDVQYPDNISSDLQLILTGLLRKNPSERFGINELQSSSYYSLEEIERGKLKCPWKRPVYCFYFYDVLNDSYFLFC
jgi:serine/threonine protein kinase